MADAQTPLKPKARPAFVPSTGRPILHNEDGTVSTEESVTVVDPRLNGGRPTNIPSIWNGQRYEDEDEIVGQALQSGQTFEAFDTIDEAVAAAKSRSEALGREIDAMRAPSAGNGTAPEGSFAWFLAKGLDPYTGQPLKEGEKPREPKRSSKRPEAKQSSKSGGKAKSAPHVVNYVPPKIGQGPGRVAGSISVNADAIGPAFRNAAESLKRALAFGLGASPAEHQKRRPSDLAQALRAAQQQPATTRPKPRPGTAARGLRAFAAHMREAGDAR